MKIEELFRSFSVTAAEWEPLIDVASRMRFNDVGSAAIVSDGKLVGIITERDLVRAISEGADVTSTRAGEYMTADPVVVSPQTDVDEAARTMARLGIAHLPVVERDHLVGVTSIRDVVLDLIARDVA